MTPDTPPFPRLDPEIVESVLEKLDAGVDPNYATLAREFPGRERSIGAVLDAFSQYRAGIHVVRASRTSDAHGDDLRSGTVVGDYRIESEIGRGAMGIVYRAHQESLASRVVALKVLPSSVVARDPRFIDRFRREAELASAIRHPNVAKVFGFGQSGDHLYFAMELVDGRALSGILDQVAEQRRRGDTRATRRDHVRQVASLARDIAAALQVIHDQGLVHRDVKPSNIIVQNDHEGDDPWPFGRAVLLDFGLARPVEDSSLTGSLTILGTPLYASPEAKIGEDVDGRTDVYSLGLVLHDLLIARRPSESESFGSRITEVRRSNPGVDRRLAAIVEMALQREPRLRYADGGELRCELDRYLNNRPIRALPSTWIGRSRLWARRNPTRFVKILAASLLLIVLAVACGWIASRLGRLYSAGSRLADNERAGNLVGALAASSDLLADEQMASLLPGLSAALARAKVIWSSPSSDLRRVAVLLEKRRQDDAESAHRILQGALLKQESEHHRPIILRFLIREIRDAPELWRWRLAAETAAQFLLICPEPYQRVRPSGTWAGDLEAALISRLAEDKPGTDALAEGRHFTVSALSGLSSVAVFSVLVAQFASRDPEHRRLSANALIRNWCEIHAANGIGSVPMGHWRAWACAVWRGVVECRSEPSERPSLWRGRLRQMLVYLAMTQVVLEEDSKKADWTGIPDEAARVLAGAVRAIRTVRGGGTQAPVEEPDPGFNLPWKTWPIGLSCKALDAPRSVFPYCNLWDRAKRGDGRVEAPAAAAGDSREGCVDFTGREPRLEGAALSASWRFAEHQIEFPPGPNAPMVAFLAFLRPGESGLELRFAIPQDSKSARVTITHMRLARFPLPRAGRVRVRVDVNDGQQIVDREVDPVKGQEPFHIELDRGLLAGRNVLNVSITVVLGTAVYRVDRVEARFRQGERGLFSCVVDWCLRHMCASGPGRTPHQIGSIRRPGSMAMAMAIAIPVPIAIPMAMAIPIWEHVGRAGPWFF